MNPSSVLCLGLLLGLLTATNATAAATDPERVAPAELHAGRAGICCLAPHLETAWMYQGPALSVRQLRPLAFTPGRHLRFGPMLRSLGEGVPDRPSGARRNRGSALALPGFGASYGLSSHLRATTNLDRGIGPYSLAPGSHFSVGVALKY